MKSAVFVFKGTVNPTPASKGSTWPSNSLPNNIRPASILNKSNAPKPAGINPSSFPASTSTSQTAGASEG